jgi:hypothetical protein
MRVQQLLPIAVLAVAVPQVIAWGNVGHRTVAYLAEKYLTAEAKTLFDALLENEFNYDFSDAATWADTIRDPKKQPWSAPWHYISKSTLAIIDCASS